MIMIIAIDTIGIHPATECCFEALQWLHERREFHNLLDMGCGNGILSLAAASIWGDAKTLAVDILEKAIEDTNKNIAVARYIWGARLRRCAATDFSRPLIRQAARLTI